MRRYSPFLMFQTIWLVRLTVSCSTRLNQLYRPLTELKLHTFQYRIRILILKSLRYCRQCCRYQLCSIRTPNVGRGQQRGISVAAPCLHHIHHTGWHPSTFSATYGHPPLLLLVFKFHVQNTLQGQNLCRHQVSKRPPRTYRTWRRKGAGQTVRIKVRPPYRNREISTICENGDSRLFQSSNARCKACRGRHASRGSKKKRPRRIDVWWYNYTHRWLLGSFLFFFYLLAACRNYHPP